MKMRPVGVVVLALAVLAGCSSILDSSGAFPDEARVTVTGSSPVPLQVVMSNNFIGIWNPEAAKWDVTLHAADTLAVTSFPFNRTMAVRETGVFFVRVTNPDVDATAAITLNVQVDDRDTYRQEATLRDASIEYVFFVN